MQSASKGAAWRALHSRIEETILGKPDSADASPRSLPDPVRRAARQD